MTGFSERADCLVCGRPHTPAGEPACDCLTHGLSRPVRPSSTGPDPADVALFSADLPDESAAAPAAHEPGPDAPPRRSGGAHRGPRRRTRIAVVAGSTVTAVVGCATLAASLVSGGRSSGDDVALTERFAGPSLALPDGGPEAGGGTAEHTASSTAPAPESSPSAEPDPPPAPSPPPAAPTEVSSAPSASPPPDAEPSVPPDPPPEPPASDAPTDVHEPPEPTAEPVLRRGDAGPEVVELQLRLRELNWLYDGDAAGHYDDETQRSVATFQVAYGVRDDPAGVYGGQTRATLEQHTRGPRAEAAPVLDRTDEPPGR